MASDKITIKDVAKKASVSIATVSRFLNNPTSIKEDKRKRVKKAIEELNYKPFSFARRLAGGNLNIYGLIIPGYEDVFYSFYAIEIIRGIGVALDKYDIDLHLHIFTGKDKFNASLVDGVIFADVINNEAQLRRLFEIKKPIVVINKKIDDLDVSYIAINNFKGAYEATEFLIRHNHKRIAHLAGALNVQCGLERLEGYKAALTRNKIEIKNEYIKITNFSRRIAKEKLEELFSLKEPPTAIFCCSDDVASEVLVYCEEKNIKIPEDISVVGFDDNPNCIYGDILLTTVRQPLTKMASLGVETLRDIIKNKINPPVKIILDTELAVRDTVTFL